MDYFGIREVCEVTLRSLRNIPACRSMTGKAIKKGEPVMYFDYLKVSNISGSVTTVYANGGRGNTRRLSWDGDKEVTFHIEDALISPTSMAILTAAQMIKRKINRVEVQDTSGSGISLEYDNSTNSNTIIINPKETNFDFKKFVSWAVIHVEYLKSNLEDGKYVVGTDADDMRINNSNIELIPVTNPVTKDTLYHLIIDSVPGQITGFTSTDLSGSAGTGPFISNFQVLEATTGKTVYKHEKYTITAATDGELQLKHTPHRDGNYPLFIFDVHDDGSMDLLSDIGGIVSGSGAVGLDKDVLKHPDIYEGNDYLVDYYRPVQGNVTSLVITADGTSDYYKLEGETLMRREKDGMDVPVAITIPKVRPRAQFEIPMSSTGDPAVFSFDFDVFPARDPGYSSCNDNVMVIIDIIEDDGDDDCHCVVEELEIWRKNNP